jgi:hypothetical protein
MLFPCEFTMRARGRRQCRPCLPADALLSLVGASWPLILFDSLSRDPGRGKGQEVAARRILGFLFDLS